MNIPSNLLSDLNLNNIVLATVNASGTHTELGREEAQRAMTESFRNILGEWDGDLEPRELEQIRACVDYAARHSAAGLPGHNLLLIVNKLVRKLDSIVGVEYGSQRWDLG
jgi:hypothetical protein